MADTVMEAFEQAARSHGDKPAMKVKRNGAWQTTTWREYREQVRRAARAFMHLGLEKGQGVAIIGYNCPEWFVTDMAAIAAGGMPAGIYTTNSPDQCKYITDHCEAPIAVVEDDAQLAKFEKVRAELPRLKAIVTIYGKSQPEKNVYSWNDMLGLADKTAEADLDARIADQKADDVATLIYTSGTTGPPKAVMITHRNITWTARAAFDFMGITEPGTEVVSYLPLSHIAEQIVSVHGPMVVGGTVWFAESLEKLGDNLREVRPHAFLGVPRVWEKIQAKVVAAGQANPPLKKKISAWARKKGLAGGYAEQSGQGKPFLYGLANKLVFSKVRERLGLDRCRVQITSAAPISKDTLEFFLSLGLPIYEVYGMSECTGPATISRPGEYKTGKVGKVIPGTEVKIAADGEICMKGPHVFKGYFKNPEATAEALDEGGWLHSGDIGKFDDQGFLQITDRKKDLLITAGGENIAPQVLEGLLKGIPGVGQVVVVGDRKKYLGALLTLDPEKIQSALNASGSSATDAAGAAKDPKFTAWLQSQIDRLNKDLARVQTIKKWTLLTTDFSIEGGELTPTMKVKRKVINEKYAKQIADLYADEAASSAA